MVNFLFFFKKKLYERKCLVNEQKRKEGENGKKRKPEKAAKEKIEKTKTIINNKKI
jgi:hypothetical protein